VKIVFGLAGPLEPLIPGGRAGNILLCACKHNAASGTLESAAVTNRAPVAAEGEQVHALFRVCAEKIA
jgi:hypothetical protein